MVPAPTQLAKSIAPAVDIALGFDLLYGLRAISDTLFLPHAPGSIFKFACIPLLS